MKVQLPQISRENEARFPIEAKQLRAMWKAGYMTANSRYWCKETSSWRSIAEFRHTRRMQDRVMGVKRPHFGMRGAPRISKCRARQWGHILTFDI